MKPSMIILTLLLPVAALASNPDNPKPVVMQGSVDVNVINSQPLPVEMSGALTVDSLPDVELAPGQSIGLAPGQQVNVPEVIFEPSDLVLVNSFLATHSSETKLVTIPKTMILRTITILPASIETDPNLYNCSAVVRWPSASNPTDPSSTDRIIAYHYWKGTNYIALNYPMPYNVKLVQGSQLEVGAGRVGSSGFCSALVVLTGTKTDL